MKALNLLLILLMIFSAQVSAEEMTQEEFNNFCNAVPESKLRAKGAKSLCSAKIDGKFLKWMYPNTVGDIEDWVDKELLEKIISANDATVSKEKSAEPSKKKKWSVSLKPAAQAPSKTIAPSVGKSSVAITPAQVEKNQSIQKDEPANLAMSREEFVELCRSLPTAKIRETTKVVGCNVSHRGNYIKWYFPHSIGDIANQIPSIIKEQEADLKQKELDIEKKRLEEQERIARLRAEQAEYRRKKALSEKQARLDAIAEQERQIAEAKRQEELWEEKRDQIIAEAKSEGRLYGFVPMNKPVEQFVKGGLSSSNTGSFLKLKKFGGLNWFLRAGCVSPDGCEKDSEKNTIYWISASSASDPTCWDPDQTIDMITKKTPEAKILAAQGRLQEYLDHPETKRKISLIKKMCAASEVKLSSDELDRIKDSLDEKYKLLEEDTFDSKYDNSIKVEKVVYSNKNDRIKFVRFYKSKLLGNGETISMHITYESSEKISKDKILRERRINKAKAKEQNAQSERDSF